MENISNFKILNTKLILSRKKFKVESVKLRLPTEKVVEWTRRLCSDSYYCTPILDGYVYMTREWRAGPEKVVTQFTASRATMEDIARELKEEIGIIGGEYQDLVPYSVYADVRSTGVNRFLAVTNFELGETDRDEDEFQEVIKLPIKELYNELCSNHLVDADTLLIAKLIEERFV